MNNRIPWDTKKFERLLVVNGYKIDRSHGDHNIWTKVGCNHIAVNRRINQMVAQRLIRENSLDIPRKLW